MERSPAAPAMGELMNFEASNNINGAAFDPRRNQPPDDDVCPICFEDFRVPCKANCGHWFCCSCILELGIHGPAGKQLECPMCSTPIINLLPEASLVARQEAEVAHVLKNIQAYNSLYASGFKSFLRRVPHSIRRMFQYLRDPLLLAFIYSILNTIVSCLNLLQLLGYIPIEMMEAILKVARFCSLCSAVLSVAFLLYLYYRLILARILAARQRRHLD